MRSYKTYYLLIIPLFISINVISQPSPQSKKVTAKFFQDFEKVDNTTPALKKKKGFTNYEELIEFLTGVVARHPDEIALSYIGESQKGKRIPMVILTAPESSTKKLRVWMQGGLHGNEPASTEGMLYLIDKLLNSERYSYLLNKIELAIVPMANIDGGLKQYRYAANGLDLNRDQTKLMAPESIVLKKSFTEFNPEVGVDFHEYNPYRRDFARMSTFGITSAYDVMFLYSGNLNVPQNLRKLTGELFVDNARKVLDQNQLRYHDYITSAKSHGEIVFNQGSIHARSSATSYALTNTISSLIEIRGVGLGRTSFKRRIYSTFLIALSYLETAYNNIDLVNNEIEKANETQKDIVVTSKQKIYKDSISAIDLESNEILKLEVSIRDALKSKATLTRERPLAYLIDRDQYELAKKLKILGANVDTLKEDTVLNVACYKIKSFYRNPEKFEKMNQQTVEVEIIDSEQSFPKGTFIIRMDQQRANIIAEVLEPEASDSFISLGVLETGQNEVLPIYRYPSNQNK